MVTKAHDKFRLVLLLLILPLLFIKLFKGRKELLLCVYYAGYVLLVTPTLEPSGSFIVG